MVTLKDVARETGLSLGTVSAILNSPAGAKYAEATRERVHAAARQLGYTPNRNAQSLRMGDNKTIGLLTRSLDNPYYAALVRPLAKAAHAAGYTLIIEQTGDAPTATEEAERLRKLLGLQVSALIALLVHHDQHLDLYRELQRRSVPLFLLGAPKDESFKGSGLRISYGAAQEALVEELARLGHRRVGFIGSMPWEPNLLPRRFEILIDRLRAQGFQSSEDDYCGCHEEMESSRAAILEWLPPRLTGPDRITALVCLSDHVAIGVLRGLYELGLRVPDDISLIGTDGIPVGRYLACQLATLAVDFDELGRFSVNCIMDLLEGRGGGPVQEAFAAHFIAGESLGRAVVS